jgi:small basic protein (TIGR04137 family)
MSMDRSLKSKASLSRHRNVLTRAERIKILEEQEKRRPDDTATGLPKVAHRKAAVTAKVKKTKEEVAARKKRKFLGVPMPGKTKAASGEAKPGPATPAVRAGTPLPDKFAGFIVVMTITRGRAADGQCW